MHVMKLALLVLFLGACLAPPLAHSGGGSDPIDMGIASARVNGKNVTVPVANNTLSPVDVEVVAHYHDGTAYHTSSIVVSLAPKGSTLATVTFTITDDINPLIRIIEDADPVEFAMALGAALWVD